MRACPDEPVRGYVRHSLVDSRVFVNQAALAHRDDTQRALELLSRSLATIKRALPPSTYAILRRVPIWIEWESQPQAMNFHPSGKWLAEHAYDPAKANTIEVSRTRDFVSIASARCDPVYDALRLCGE